MGRLVSNIHQSSMEVQPYKINAIKTMDVWFLIHCLMQSVSIWLRPVGWIYVKK